MIMAGAYCNFCGHRCFVYRVIPDGPKAGWAGHLATCHQGMEHDREQTGHDYITAGNPAEKTPVMRDTMEIPEDEILTDAAVRGY